MEEESESLKKHRRIIKKLIRDTMDGFFYKDLEFNRDVLAWMERTIAVQTACCSDGKATIIDRIEAAMENMLDSAISFGSDEWKYNQ